jgi:hypothetical protein
MAIERRDFIKAGFAGLSAGLVSTELARAQSYAGRSKGVLEGGTGSVRVEGRLKSGVLTVEAEVFEKNGDRCLIMNGKLGSTDLYCSMFSYKDEESVFAVLRSNDHTTSLLLSNSGDLQIANLFVWNDAQTPGTFRIDKDKFMATQKFKEAVLDDKGESLDLVGKRNPPQFTLNELEAVFHDNEALNEFMRGRRSHHDRAPDPSQAFSCYFISSIPGALYILGWYAR